MHRKLARKASDAIRKNKDDFRGLLLGIYPEFVYRKTEKLHENEIPVFTFHAVHYETFDKQLKYLSDNNYTTLKADEFYEVITGSKGSKTNSIVLTFDDGHASLWTYAYPLLKKYGFCAISFIVSGRIKEREKYYPNLEDLWSGNATCCDFMRRHAIEPLVNWEEIMSMHDSGHVDFQSHTLFHNSVNISERIIDFVNPDFQSSYLKGTFSPIVRKNGRDVPIERAELGMPIYKWAPMMVAEKRYVEDEELGKTCVRYIEKNGGVDFFRQPGWRKKMKILVAEFDTQYGRKDRYETKEERYSGIYQDLFQSRIAIEDKLGKSVRHLCYPWYEGSELSRRASIDAGYLSNYWGILGKRAVNRVHDDPYSIVRINENFIFSLPGIGRRSLGNILMRKYSSILERKTVRKNLR